MGICTSEKCLKKNLCKKCVNGHFQWHMDQNDVFTFIPIKSQKNQGNFCKNHSTEKLSFYCLQCKEMICIFCKEEEKHKHHTWEPAKEIQEKYIKEITKICKNFEKKEVYANQVKKDKEEGVLKITEISQRREKLVEENMAKNQKRNEAVTKELIEKLKKEREIIETEYKGKYENLINTLKILENV
jgi:hypothetical protein